MIFVHDHTFIKKNEKHYTSGSLNNNLFERYIEWFGRVEVLANVRQATEKDKRVIQELNVVDNVKLRLFNKKNNLLNLLKNIKVIGSVISKQDFLVARVPSVYGIIAVWFARKNNKPYLLEVVGCPWDALWNHSWKGKLVAPFMWIFTKMIVKNAPFALYVTNKFLQKRYPCSGLTIGCSDVVLPPSDLKIIDKRLKNILHMTTNNPIVIGTLAAVDVRYKGQEYVIRAISNLNRKAYSYIYYVAGPGDNNYLKSIAEKYGVSDKIIFLGSLPHQRIFDFLDNIDIYIQPSNTEGMPRALIEAMSRGCPSIGTNVGGIPELINNKYVFRKKSVKEIEELLIKISNKNEMLNEAKNNFYKSKEFNEQILKAKRNSFYENFISCIKEYDSKV